MQLWLCAVLVAFLAAGTKVYAQDPIWDGESSTCDVILPIRLTTGEARFDLKLGRMWIGDIHFMTQIDDGTLQRILKFLRLQAMGVKTSLDVIITERIFQGNGEDKSQPEQFTGKLLKPNEAARAHKIFQFFREGREYIIAFEVNDPHLSGLLDNLVCKPKLQLVFAVPNGT